MGNRIRDILLVLVAAGLVVAAILPTAEEEKPPVVVDEQPVDVDTPKVHDGPDTKEQSEVVPGASAPILDVEHLYFPLVPGSTWVYRVEGTEDMAGGETWTAVLERAPTEEEPGVMLAGYDQKRARYRVWLEGGAISTDALPAVMPLQFGESEPVKLEGRLMPGLPYLIEGGVWNQIFKRQVTYESKDRAGVVRVEKAQATQTDRAMVVESDETIVPAGRFSTLQIQWISRVEMNADKRKVLAKLTAEPFRKETMWLAKGVGIVRRHIEYLGTRSGTLSFDLVMYKRPAVESYD